MIQYWQWSILIYKNEVAIPTNGKRAPICEEDDGALWETYENDTTKFSKEFNDLVKNLMI